MTGPLLLLLAVLTTPPELAQSLDSLEREVGRTRVLAPDEPSRRRDPALDLATLRRQWITAKTFDLLSKRYETLKAGGAPKTLSEIAFRLSRHAFLLGRPEAAKSWLARIEDRPETVEWISRGLYLSGLIALREGDADQASALFTASMTKAPLDSPTATHSKMALARLAFDQGRFADAQALYASIPKRSASYEDSLQESAWNDVRLNKPDRAATNLDLLFTLYPESRRLPEAGYLLGSVIETEQGLAEKAKALDNLVIRLAFEADSTRNALSAYSGHEEQALSDIDVTLRGLRLNAILPPIGHQLLQREPLVTSHLAHLREIQDDQDELEGDRASLAAIRLALSGDGATTIDEVVVLEWANSLERRISGLNQADLSEPEVLASKRENLKTTRKDAVETSETLLEIERHVDISWIALTGNRQKLALELKNKVRAELEKNDLLQKRLLAAEALLDAVSLKVRKRAALADATGILTFRKKEVDVSQLYQRLDAVRTGIERAFQAERAGFRGLAAKSEADLKGKEKRLETAREAILKRARIDLRDVMTQNREEIVGQLRKYRWASADARYRLLRATEKGLADARRRAELESNELEKRYSEFAAEAPPAFPVSSVEASSLNPAFQERLRDLAYFRSRAKAFTEEARRRVSDGIERERARYSRQHLREEAQALDNQARSREESIFGYQLYLGDDPRSEQTPFALYRLAQLQFERAESEERLGKTAAQSAEIRKFNYELAVAPLNRIRQEYPKFEQRDAALYLLGYALVDIGRDADSLSVFEQLVRESPKSRLAPEVRLRIGEHYFKQRKFAQAIPHYQEVLTFGFNYFYDKALYKLAWANYMLGRYDSAIAHFLILLDYSAELSAEDRARFVEFADEATEYVAFSMYRSGGAPTAERIFAKTGWKPYTLQVLLRMGRIASDRGEREKALSIFTLAAREFPLSSAMPEIASNEIRLLEELKLEERVVTQMAAAYRLFARDGRWWQSHSQNPEALAEADALMQRVLLSLASRYETAKRPDRAEQVYADLVARFPESAEAYEATFRRGEMAYARGDYSGAIVEYDRLAKSGRFNEHFSDALFGTVAGREKTIAGKGGMDAVIAGSGGVAPPEAVDLTASIDNFAKRAPSDPRVPEALYRKAAVHEKLKAYDQARQAYLDVATKYPKSAWREEALVASVNAVVTGEKWPEAAALATDLLERNPDVRPETQKKLRSLAEGARFKEAEGLASGANQREAVSKYLKFQTDFPKSELASKALFNAFAIGKKDGYFAPASEALEKLLKEYPRSAESVSVRYEQAILHDGLFELSEAEAKYKEAIAGGLSKERRRTALVNLAALTRGSARKKADLEKMEEYAAQLDGSAAGPVMLDAATAALDLGEESAAMGFFSNLAENPRYAWNDRAQAAGAAAFLLWKTGKTERAIGFEKMGMDLLRRVPTGDRARASAKLAMSFAKHVAHDRLTMSKVKISTRSERELASSFKRKAKSLQELERSVLNLLQLPSLLSGASGLYDLGLAYRDFVIELEAIPAPKEGKEDFEKTIASLTAPLKNKSIEALKRAQKILSDERLPAAFYSDLVEQLKLAGVVVPSKPEEDAFWAERVSPEAPPLKRPASAAGLPKSEAVTELERGISELRSIWSKEDRKKASTAFGKALTSDPTLVQAGFNLAVVQLFDGERSSAASLIQSLVPKLEEADTESLRALFSLLYEDPATARSHMERALVTRPTDLFALGQLALLELSDGSPEKALERAKAALRENPRSAFAHELLALAFLRNKNRTAARLAFERAYSIASDSPSLDSSLALFLDPERDLELRTTLLKTSGEKHFPEGRSNWGRLAYDTWNTSAACAEWRAAESDARTKQTAILNNLRICSRLKEGITP